MTISELCSFCQKNDKTIRRWIKKAGKEDANLLDKMSTSGHGKSADFTIDEVEKILKASTMSKDAISILMENAQTSNAPTFKASLLSESDLEIITKIVSATVQATMQQFEKKYINSSSAPAIEAPKKDTRARITELVRKYAKETNSSYRDVYTSLYTEYGYRTHTNPSKCAINREMKIIDYLDSVNELEKLEAVAIDFLKVPQKFHIGYLAE